ncbi:L-serine ammonia-lyase, iron-sulfur-dependent subunit beta [Jeotgalibacillus sp. R-1-5s-1]|uniref:L-serine ammonia-lyase, iron-sulfur-dependent subunit beta n=1 Tax=Jeotgalibacillus sp. R-1-5s-1 TaxID=2555897 RepID=UPI00106D9BBE|nr:L-serine ammonia-lyase, iron-sulfur-dependent subunit beta [Jeotgalibacillus sp. R-1-5s-1]TFE03534.1 L-serine ammonia-lyase, iron-sulfur-dependent, subunit beta [Jeotgalibacillus sp. R-1-5s-1]
MKYKSVFDIIGPVMIGPSSSHTAGAARIGKMARELFGREPEWATISFYGSFAKTYKGHGTDVAIIGGIMDFETDDERIIQAREIAREKRIRIKIREEEALTDHPNTARIRLGDQNGEMELVGISIGGGKIEITELNGFALRLTGHHPAILVVHEDRFGAVAAVSKVLAENKINIGSMDVSRQDVGKMALMTIEVDEPVEDIVLEKLKMLPEVTQVTKIAD